MDRFPVNPDMMAWLEAMAAEENARAVGEVNRLADAYYPTEPHDYEEALTDEEVQAIEDWVERTQRKDPQRFATQEQREAAWDQAGGRCYYCKTDVPKHRFHADHIVAHSRGGRTSPANLVCSCPRCNIAKGAMQYGEFIRGLTEGGLEWRDALYRQQVAWFQAEERLACGQ